ncbi:hypothetical protein O0555_21585 [Brevibacillus laterosporus]|uniref:hypothetical protein n=1 Tax=Brevibacillus laterosporus TaxID=1465 RepID=UPI0018CD1AB4|nr:hypothetical protein [Brevibacillus laterosporus]MBG9797139.1 hypothetical protein [Brevibacillus laterosporus]MCR8939897.1 hypothetical protein [Brevibacillus laterosporus]MCZ0842537.1 hypothetical protein [Brevibacillus laterosporus]MCZ0847579.1 hypothetical protein [Brevibacillus laterosporus]MED1909559.1 hypothetical protein [Brevibacillus laterosporus]
MNPIMKYPSGYSLDSSGNFAKWKTEKQLLRQRLLNALLMRSGVVSIPGYENAGSKIHSLKKIPLSERLEQATLFAKEALQHEIDQEEISAVTEVRLLEDSGQLIVAVSLPSGEILDLEVPHD